MPTARPVSSLVRLCTHEPDRLRTENTDSGPQPARHRAFHRKLPRSRLLMLLMMLTLFALRYVSVTDTCQPGEEEKYRRHSVRCANERAREWYPTTTRKPRPLTAMVASFAACEVLQQVYRRVCRPSDHHSQQPWQWQHQQRHSKRSARRRRLAVAYSSAAPIWALGRRAPIDICGRWRHTLDSDCVPWLQRQSTIVLHVGMLNSRLLWFLSAKHIAQIMPLT